MKQLILFIISISSTTIVFGQQNKFYIGLEGGSSMTFLRGEGLEEKYNYDPVISYSGGLFFQYNLPKLISIRTNLTFERKGSVKSGTISGVNNCNYVSDFTSRSNFEYLTVPILIRAGLGNKTKFFINTGPFFSYLMKQTFLIQGPCLPKYFGDNTKNNKRIDMGITTGLGVEIPIKERISISCEIRNNLGLYNVSRVSTYNNGTIMTNSTNLLIGITYKLRKQHLETK